jgi:NapC/NirT cytochrome c family, N-terminal region/Doubled CXXCH motif (Paired_CXXCH_1)
MTPDTDILAPPSDAEVSPGPEPAATGANASETPPPFKPSSGVAAGQPPRPKRRRGWLIVLGIVAVLAFLMVFFIGSVELLHFTEAASFCDACHIMDPETTVWRNSPHARTECGTCHVGPGALPAIQAKLANVRYLWVYPLGGYEKPIPSPIHSLRPVEVVCEQCHWPQKFYENRLVTKSSYAQDEANSLTQTEFALKTGGGEQAAGQGRGIHWHIDNPVYYIATDEKRQEIPWVQAEYNGVTTTYKDVNSQLTDADLANMEKRKMDCVDCHNRATHIFRRPSEALDESMSRGLIAADLPDIKEQGVAVLEKTYATEAEAATAIAAVEDFYRTQHPDVYAAREEDVKRAVTELQTIFDNTQFPATGADWETHKNNIGHKDFPGCFRCHDGKHLSADNQAIRLECNLCHTIPLVALPGQPVPPIALAPSVPEPESHHSTTWLSEHRYRFDASCANCHTVDNPGGSDNSSFCSNSACHGTDWQYAGLDAPKVKELAAPPSVPSGVAKAIPHPISPKTDCQICHIPEGVRPAPENHASFTDDMCTSCHGATLEEQPIVITPTPVATTGPEGAATPVPSGPPAIPHEVAGREQCLMCHDPVGNVRPAPQDHAGRTVDTCQMCHKLAGTVSEATPQPAATVEAGGGIAAAPPIPHDLAGRDDCLVCHNPAGGLRPAPADHAGRTKDVCQTCHKPAGTSSEAMSQPSATAEEGGAIAGAPRIPHDLAGRDDCLVCHNPAGGLRPAPADHSGRTKDVCQTCHQPED